MMKCSNCDFEFDGKFCPECGTKAAPTAPAETLVTESTVEKVATEKSAAAPVEKDAQAAPEISQDVEKAEEIPVTPSGEVQYVYVPDGKGGYIPVMAGGQAGFPIAPNAPVAEPKPQKEKVERPKGAGISGFKATIEKIIAKADEKGVVTNGYRYLPAAVSLFYGFLILIFMACSGASAFGMSIGSVYDLISEPDGAAGPVALIIIAIGFLLCGALKMFWAVKFPYYKNTALNIAQDVLFFFAFIFACVTVGYGNTVASAGAGGALILTFTLLGAFFPIAGALLFRFGFLDGIKEKQTEAAETFKAYWAEKKANKPVAGVAVAAGVGSAGSDVTYTRALTISSDSCEDLTPTRFVRSRLFRPAFACLFTALIMSLWFVVRPDAFSSVGGSSSVDTLRFTATAWVLVCIASMTVIGILRAITAYRNPYEKHPALFMWNIAAMTIFVAISGVYTGITVSDSSSYSVAESIFTVISALVIFLLYIIAAYETMNANTYKNRAKIKAARAAALASPKKMPAWKIIVVCVMTLGVVALCAVPPIVESSNKFNVSKVSRVELGMSYDEVIRILGKPYKETETGGKMLEYYSNNYVSVMGKETNADDIGSLDDLENALEEELKKEEKLANMVFKGIAVTLNSDGKVTSVILDTQLKVKDQIKKDEPYSENVKVFVSDKLKDSNGLGKIVYSVTYSDGSYESAVLPSYEIDSSSSSNYYDIKFTPGLYSGKVSGRLDKSWVQERTKYAYSVGQLSLGMSVDAMKSIMGEGYDSSSYSSYYKYVGADGTAEISLSNGYVENIKFAKKNLTSRVNDGITVTREYVNGYYKVIFYSTYSDGSFQRAMLGSNYTKDGASGSRTYIVFTDSFATTHRVLVTTSWLN